MAQHAHASASMAGCGTAEETAASGGDGEGASPWLALAVDARLLEFRAILDDHLLKYAQRLEQAMAEQRAALANCLAGSPPQGEQQGLGPLHTSVTVTPPRLGRSRRPEPLEFPPAAASAAGGGLASPTVVGTASRGPAEAHAAPDARAAQRRVLRSSVSFASNSATSQESKTSRASRWNMVETAPSRVLHQIMRAINHEYTEASESEHRTARMSHVGSALEQGWTNTTVSRLPQHRSCFTAFVRSSPFDYCMGMVIVANAAFIGWQSDFHARHPGQQAPDSFLTTDAVFSVIFLLELLLRILAFRWEFFNGAECRWNIFDCFVVLISTTEQTIRMFGDTRTATVDVTYLRVMRILKLARVIRIVRVVRVFRELRIMLLSVVATMRSLLWTLISLFLLTFVASVYVATSVADYQAVAWDHELDAYFGSLPKTLLSLFQATAGGVDWRALTLQLEKVSAVSVSVFLFYVCLVLYAIMNILTGVCVNQATRAADDDVEFVIQDELSKHSGAVATLRKFFHEADLEDTGTLTWPQLRRHLRDPKVQAYFKTLDLEAWDLRTFFELLQAGGEDEQPCIGIDQFVRGCMRLKGNAKTADLVALRHEMDLLAKSTAELRVVVKKEVGEAVRGALQESSAGPEGVLHPVPEELACIRTV